MLKPRKTLAGAAAAALLVSLPAAVPSPSYGYPGAEVYGPRSHPLGMSYERWLTRSMTWLQEIPAPKNPVTKPASSRNCDVHGRVVFMGPFGTGNRVCNVPAGKVIALNHPVIYECSTAEGNGRTYRKLRRCAVRQFEKHFARARVGIRIDGDRLQQPRAWIFTSMGNVVNFPRNNIWGVEGGPTKSVTRGVLFLIKPLDPGRHLISLVGRGDVPRWRFKVIP